MQTPVLEAFTNNTSLMKTKLISINRNNILFMPILAPNTKGEPSFNSNINSVSSYGGYYVLADEFTGKLGGQSLQNTQTEGVIFGFNNEQNLDYILIDQGINGDGDLNIKTPFPTDLIETAYMVKLDHRLLSLSGKTDLEISGDFTPINHSFVDDDGIATYYIAQGDPGFISATDRHVSIADSDLENTQAFEQFAGPLGTRLAIAPRSSLNVRQSDGLFSELGSASSSDSYLLSRLTDVGAHKFIDTIMNVVGVTTGYSLDIPIRILKKDR